MSQQKILAIDYGEKRLGLAKNSLSLAEPLEIIANDEQTIAKLKQICAKYTIDLIVLGLSEGETLEKTKKFAEFLSKNIPIPIDFVDETLSTYEVTTRLEQAQIKKRPKYIDHYAAALILENYLELHQDQHDCSTCPMRAYCH